LCLPFRPWGTSACGMDLKFIGTFLLRGATASLLVFDTLT
jgi:hypothetical protein